jgi:hypothetical protein
MITPRTIRSTTAPAASPSPKTRSPTSPGRACRRAEGQCGAYRSTAGLVRRRPYQLVLEIAGWRSCCRGELSESKTPTWEASIS